MSERIVQLNEEVNKGQRKELVRCSVAKTLTEAARYEQNEAWQGYRSGHYYFREKS